MYSESQRDTLLRVARASIRYGLDHAKPLPVTLTEYDEQLRAKRASFVTLHLDGELRGCIGVLEAIRPLIEDIADNAYSAAFRDPRFSPVREDEFEALDIHISVLSEAESIQFESEADLLAQIRPGVDGLILKDGRHRGTFLPSVWEGLPDAADFLRQLKRKAGLPGDYWSESLTVERYTTESFGDE